MSVASNLGASFAARRRVMYAAVTLLVGAAACGGSSDMTGPGGGGGAVASVTLDQSSASVTVGSTVTLTATARDSQGAALSGRAITWTTSDSTIASVSNAGVVTGKAIGSATVTATSEGKSAPATISVTAVAAAAVTLSASSASIVAGLQTTFTAVVKDAGGNVLTGRTLTWTSSAPGVATVDASGKVTGIAAGTTTISATSGTATGSATVTVTPPPVASVTVTPTADTLASFGDTATFSAAVKDAGGSVIPGQTVVWATSNDTIATVSATGLVTAIHSGTATITATSGGKTGSATVVIPAVAQIVITPSSSSIHIGANETLTIVLEDSNGRQLGNRVVEVFNNNPSIVTVSGRTVTGVAAGTATVTYKTEGVAGTATIVVTP